MERIVKYRAADGTEFETLEDCRLYEHKYKAMMKLVELMGHHPGAVSIAKNIMLEPKGVRDVLTDFLAKTVNLRKQKDVEAKA